MDEVQSCRVGTRLSFAHLPTDKTVGKNTLPTLYQASNKNKYEKKQVQKMFQSTFDLICQMTCLATIHRQIEVGGLPRRKRRGYLKG